MMQRRHFERIAGALRTLRERTDNPGELDGMERAVVAIANVCYDSNARFDYDVFYRACGLPLLEVK